MRLSVHHITRFEFDQPSGHSIHDVRLTPKPASGQRLLSWRIDGPGKRSEWVDGHGNNVTTFSLAQEHDMVEIAVAGVYDFSGGDQWLRYGDVPTLPAPFWLRNTGLARHDKSFDQVIEGLAERAADPTQSVVALHELMERVGKRIAYKTGVSTVDTTAVEALERGAGVAQELRACLHRLLPPSRRAGALCQRLPAQRRRRAARRPHEPFVGRGLGSGPRLGGLRSDQRHLAPRRFPQGRRRARLSRRGPGERPPHRLW